MSLKLAAFFDTFGVIGHAMQEVPECGLPQPSSLTRVRHIILIIIANIRNEAGFRS